MPLKKFTCGICGAESPKEYLKHGQMKKRMKWLRNHYRRKHPAAYKKAWG